jgi:GH15 family glucan-1,4-alpha-glucosidase
MTADEAAPAAEKARARVSPASVAPIDSSQPGEPWLPLTDYGLIGNEKTGALVSRHGSIDWACFPRFDSPSVFARLLDRRGGGCHRLAPVERYLSHHQYVIGTNILTTFFELRPGVALTVTDFMPMGPPGSTLGGDPRIVRQLRARGAPIEVLIVADPRFDYGRSLPTWSLNHDLAEAYSGADRLTVSSPWPWRMEASVAVSSGTVHPNEPVFAQVRWGGAPAPEPSPSSLLTVTDAYWRGWVSPPDAPMRRVAARWQPWVERSELVLKLLSYADLGSFVAAPTTSLPEWPGGPRNWDYRYVWIRDAAFTAQVLLLLGHVNEARAYLGWAFDRATQVAEGQELRPLYTVDGGVPPPEIELPHLEGYRGSQPVRVGNGARAQRQLDIYGEILDAVLILERLDPAFVRDHWSTIEHLAQRVAGLWDLPDAGMWEERAEPAHHVHSKLMCWVALDRAIQLAQKFGRTEYVDLWTRVAEEIRTAILTRGYDEQLGSFIKAFDRPVLDANTLRVGLVGFLPPTDPRVIGTVAAVERVLGRGPFLMRYQGDDGLAGPEGTFLLCSFWLVESLAKSGQRDRALQHWRALLDVAGPLLLFSEEFDPASNQPLGNYPQAFTHIGVLRAAFALGLMATDE